MVEALSRALRLWPLLLAGVTLPCTVLAHRLDEVLQATLVVIEPGEIHLRINVVPGVAVAERVLALLDPDHDGVISAPESAAYAEKLARDVVVRLDGRPVVRQPGASDFPTPEEIHTGAGIIQIEIALAPVALAAGLHRLSLENRHLPGLSVYLINAALPKSEAIRIVSQQRNETQSTGEIEFSYLPPARPARTVGLRALAAALRVVLAGGMWWFVRRRRTGGARRATGVAGRNEKKTGAASVV